MGIICSHRLDMKNTHTWTPPVHKVVLLTEKLCVLLESTRTVPKAPLGKSGLRGHLYANASYSSIGLDFEDYLASMVCVFISTTRDGTSLEWHLGTWLNGHKETRKQGKTEVWKKEWGKNERKKEIMNEWKKERRKNECKRERRQVRNRER